MYIQGGMLIMYKLIYREKHDDRDCCAYVELQNCKVVSNRIHGACYISNIDKDLEYEDIETYLTKEEFEWLRDSNNFYKYPTMAEQITNHILSAEADDFISMIEREEDEYIKRKYDLSDDDLADIFNNFSDYHDRSIICAIYNDVEDFASEALENGLFGRIDETLKNYIDLKRLGEDIAEDCCIVLSDGRVVEFSY